MLKFELQFSNLNVGWFNELFYAKLSTFIMNLSFLNAEKSHFCKVFDSDFRMHEINFFFFKERLLTEAD